MTDTNEPLPPEPGTVPDPDLGIPADQVDAPLDPPEDDQAKGDAEELEDQEDV